MITIKGSDR